MNTRMQLGRPNRTESEDEITEHAGVSPIERRIALDSAVMCAFGGGSARLSQLEA